ncbi:MlaA family lipoprotein [Aquicella lusitana]|uniref:Phospholipid-binding lipoprotein MlaA n=1 Tax=Aquicella lusitana TaxID=254246 RepID=A0A370GEM2_9COXI|nr:VacJ family lipoprotein [Aquicella lusitana]RDI41710.1 phospholipid-binding lipoprotein MlaA [Aquicella lusitana]VVC72686.1 putative phospholipid-binding lipoprotein MlaA [Aquicella lusitana]
MNDKKQKRSKLLAPALMIAIISGVHCSPGYAETVVNPDTSVNSSDSSASADTATTTANNKDPLERFNRVMFTFNDKLDQFILKPVATVYNKIMPKPLNKGIHNFFNNIGELPTIANDVLQLNFYQASNDFWRFGVNTTVGILGFFDVASRINLKYYSNDFGLTLAAWGYKSSNYLVLPFFGPSTIRDGIGLPVDYFAFSVYPYIEPDSTRYAVYALGAVDRRAQLLKFESVMEEAALDKYVFVRNAYLQRRSYQIEQNKQRGYQYQADQQEETPLITSAAAVSPMADVESQADTSTQKAGSTPKTGSEQEAESIAQ